MSVHNEIRVKACGRMGGGGGGGGGGEAIKYTKIAFMCFHVGFHLGINPRDQLLSIRLCLFAMTNLIFCRAMADSLDSFH